MPGEVVALRADGDRVWVRTVGQEDVPTYRVAVEQSRTRLSAWNPVNPDDLIAHLAAQSRAHRTFLVHARRPEGMHDVVGKVNVTSVVRGRFSSAVMGYDAYDPYAGRGLFAEGMHLVLDLAFAPEPKGMGLHRVEASVQPANSASAGLLRSLGLRREGQSPRLMWLADADGLERWRDHDHYAVTVEEWPAGAYAAQGEPRIVCLVNGVPGAGKTSLARQLSVELGIPLFSKDRVKEAVADALGMDQVANDGISGSLLGAGASEALWGLLQDSPTGGVVESWFWPDDARWVGPGLERAGLDPGIVPEIWCDVSVAVARQRSEQRTLAGERHPVHGPQVGLDDMWKQVEQAARPLGVGPSLRMDTSRPLCDADVTRLALEIRRLHGR